MYSVTIRAPSTRSTLPTARIASSRCSVTARTAASKRIPLAFPLCRKPQDSPTLHSLDRHAPALFPLAASSRPPAPLPWTAPDYRSKAQASCPPDRSSRGAPQSPGPAPRQTLRVRTPRFPPDNPRAKSPYPDPAPAGSPAPRRHVQSSMCRFASGKYDSPYGPCICRHSRSAPA